MMMMMIHMISRVAFLSVLGGLLLVPQALGADEDQSPQVSIVEPAFRPPQEWSYTPNDLTAAVGATITWTNTGAVAHTVTADDGTSFDSGTLDPQAIFSVTPDTPGIYAYHCTFHPWMTGSFTVAPSTPVVDPF
jgi:plastocyanin